ncbi:hypothetical protein Tco_0831131 [Tanacetum coccineum]
MIDLNPRLHDLQEVKTKCALKINDEEFKKAKSEVTRKIRKLAKVYDAWLPPWLVSRLVVYQPYVKNHWKEFMFIQGRIWDLEIKKKNLGITLRARKGSRSGDGLSNIKECLDKVLKDGIGESGNKNNESANENYKSNNGDILFGTVSPLEAFNADKIDNYYVNTKIKLKIKTNVTINHASGTFAKVVIKEELSKNLFSIPTSIKDNSDEVIIFDKDIVEEGSKK